MFALYGYYSYNYYDEKYLFEQDTQTDAIETYSETLTNKTKNFGLQS